MALSPAEMFYHFLIWTKFLFLFLFESNIFIFFFIHTNMVRFRSLGWLYTFVTITVTVCADEKAALSKFRHANRRESMSICFLYHTISGNMYTKWKRILSPFTHSTHKSVSENASIFINKWIIYCDRVVFVSVIQLIQAHICNLLWILCSLWFSSLNMYHSFPCNANAK